jgi:DNA-binding transcriptional MocR family regulator
MKRYEKFADEIAELIRSGVLGPGEKVPSVRHASRTYGVSPSTVFQAYYLLEDPATSSANMRSARCTSRKRPCAPRRPPRWTSANWCSPCSPR